MTATLPRSPAATPARSTTTPPGGGGPAGRRPLGLDPTLPSTIALTVTTLGVAVGFGRLFTNGSFLVPVVLATVTAHAVAWWCRRRELPTGVSATAAMAAVGLVAAWTLLGHTTAYGVPLPLTLRTALEALGAARSTFRVVKAPTDPVTGFVLACVMAVGISAFMADWAAFRIQATYEAIIPAFSLFLFTSALGTAHLRMAAVVLFAAPALAFLVVHGLARTNRAGAWFGGRPVDGPLSLVRTAALLGAVALVGALVVGPRLPTANDRELLHYKNRPAPGPTNRATISPLVDIRTRLVDHRDLEVFTAKAPVRAYWRLTSLDTFDGSIWSSNDTYHATNGGIGTDERLRQDLPVVDDEQQLTIAALSSIWLPTAFRPDHIQGLKGVSYNPDTASLITKENTTDGDEYTIRSQVPQPTPELLDQATNAVPADVAARYLPLPDINVAVLRLANRIVAGATTPYAKAKALQDFFHTSAFTYDLNAKPGHDSRALENFLFRTKRGYCEQFAGAYAVLARMVGLPTRVAVGFTPGELRTDGLYHVRDEHAHAWPEVYLDGFGWVAFEPTPGRGNPQAEQYTGVAPAQSTTGDLPTSTTTSPTTGATTGPDTSTTIDFGQDRGAGATNGAHKDKGIPGVVKGLLVLVLLAALWAITVPLLHLRRRRLRHARPGSAAAVLAEWSDVAELLSAAGITRRPSETMAEYARRAAASSGLQTDAARALRQLAGDAAAAAYAGLEVPAELVERAQQSATLVREAIFDQVTMTERVKWWLDPRPLVGAEPG